MDLTLSPTSETNYWNGTVDFGDYGEFSIAFFTYTPPRDFSQVYPFEEDFISKETKGDLEKLMKRNPKMSFEDACRVWRLVESIGASSMGVWTQIAGVHGGGSPIMETITLNAEIDYEAKKNIAKYLAGMIKGLDQSNELRRIPEPFKAEL